jgi:hypothetical protein
MPGGLGGRSVLFTAPDGNHFAELSARRRDFTNPAVDAKIALIKNQRLAIDHLTLKIGSWAQ